MSKKKFIWLSIAAILGAFIGTLIVGIGTAKADDNSYLSRLANNGFTGPIGAWLDDGYYICDARNRGVATNVIALVIYYDTGSTIDMADAYDIVHIADQELCGGQAFA